MIPPRHPGWTVLVALGNDIPAEQVQVHLRRCGVTDINARELLEAAQAVQALDLPQGRVQWDSAQLHRATLAVVEDPLAHKAALLSPLLDNTLRWTLYLNRADQFGSLLRRADTGRWLDYFNPIDLDWLGSRDPILQKILLSRLAPMWWRRAEPPHSLEKLVATGQWPEIAVELAVAQGDEARVDLLLRRNKRLRSQGYGEMLMLLRGQLEAAHRGFLKRPARLAGMPALFGRLAALRMRDLEAARHARYAAPAYPELSRYLDMVAAYLRHEETKPWEEALFGQPGPGLGLCLVCATEAWLPPEHLPDRAEAREQARQQLQRQGLEGWARLLDESPAPAPERDVHPAAGGHQVVVQLTPLRQGLRVRLRVRPLGDDGPIFPLARGPAQEKLRWRGRTLCLERDLTTEQAARDALVASCPALHGGDDHEFPDPNQALEVLLQLQQARAPLEWPGQTSWTVRAAAIGQPLRLQAQGGEGWFTLQGQLQLDDGRVVELARLLEIARDSQGRFVALGEGHFLELTQELRRKLQAIDEVVEVRRRELRLSPLSVPTLAELDESIKGDDSFQAALDRFRLNSEEAPLPPLLQAELRDYQIEGFRWMARRCRVGAGVCLADDMGLGKTVQTIALLLQEAGPHLVLCPTSVTGNWLEEISRFAPTLQPVLLEGRRRGQLLEPGASDVVLCSYRVLLRERPALRQISWGVAVLDEAQYIKNPDSKTARACFDLPARARVATTGTPIENRLSELWSIFRFLNPGLLGNLTRFRQRLENDHQRLQRLVAPFILRRTKAQVLHELPPRTEISLSVELSREERALYESVRRRAVEGLRGQLDVLAQLTRLRQACCHPQLLLPHEPLTSAKFETFFALAEELQGGQHRTLVFSQFVELLRLLEAELRRRGMSALVLDGSTPVAQRRERVAAFQGGQADFFLISLKAGGIGLNLTAADYVVHLDPWWNPAAEDQASDRAHRLGQTRPVTIYRLIATDTVEEKVVKLHGIKRQLAQSLLEGADGQAALSAENLLELLRD